MIEEGVPVQQLVVFFEAQICIGSEQAQERLDGLSSAITLASSIFLPGIRAEVLDVWKDPASFACLTCGVLRWAYAVWHDVAVQRLASMSKDGTSWPGTASRTLHMIGDYYSTLTTVA